MHLLTLGHGTLAQAALAALVEGARIERIRAAGVRRDGDLLLYDGEAA